jgi:hypothetical protein
VAGEEGRGAAAGAMQHGGRQGGGVDAACRRARRGP